DLFAQSRFESSAKGRHLTLVTALEVLSERREGQGRAAQLVEEFRQAITQRAREAEPAERGQNQSLQRAAHKLRAGSISAATRHLAASVPSSVLTGGVDPIVLVRESYSARSELIHDGVTNRDLTALLGPLEELVRYLCLPSPPEEP